MKILFLVVSICLCMNVKSISCFSVGDLFCRIFSWCGPDTYKLTYFGIKGRAEFIRFIFAQAGQAYIDNRVESSDWPAIKSTFPFAQLPVLNYTHGSETIVISQSQAIARFLAGRFDLAGRTELESALIDMYAAQCGDLFNAYASEASNNQTDMLFNQTWPTNLAYFETRLAANGNGYLVGSRLSWADLYISQLTDFMFDEKDSMLENFPLVKQLDMRVRSLPRISQWISTRPITDI